MKGWLRSPVGDFLADSSVLGCLGGALLIRGFLVLILLATFLTRLSRVLLFWIVFVLTRSFGATVGDSEGTAYPAHPHDVKIQVGD
jgi:uncharacterized membrane-anchored protein